ncbi:hypothetical protein ScalyP_jg2061 [Parmales sp. scaly parma]|nr:hypothetical protein ScalyP_jg2061 [Parmales sp. scaly parma]
MLIINGLVVKDPKDPRAIAYHAQKLAQANRPYYYYNALTFLILIVIATSVRTYLSDPFRLHSIPAAARHPADHAPYFASDDMLVRTIMEPRFPTTRNFTNSTGSRKFLDSFWRSGFDEGEELSASAGGRHGHVPEAIDVDNESETGESLRVTRCSTVAAALTAYFCGGDAVTAYSNGTLPEYSNDDGSLNLFLKSAAILNTRDVVRVSIGARSNKHTPFSHTWVIVSIGDGRFLWLQGFIQKYSLHGWLESVKKSNGGDYSYDLETIEKKLELLRLLSEGDHTEWTTEANDAYNDLFGVDLLKSARQKIGMMRAKAETEIRKDDVVYGFKREDDLLHVSFAPLCQFPLKASETK